MTHCHTDHAGNINAFNEIWLHSADTLLMDRLNKPYGGKINYLKDGQIFDLGETTIEVRHMPPIHRVVLYFLTENAIVIREMLGPEWYGCSYGLFHLEDLYRVVKTSNL